MKFLLILLPWFSIIISVTSSPFHNSWRIASDEEGPNPWRNHFTGSNRRTESLRTNDDPNSWRSQKRSLDFFNVKKFPFYSYFERHSVKNDKKDGEPDVKVQTWNPDEHGVISCPPEYPKCIPRLGR